MKEWKNIIFVKERIVIVISRYWIVVVREIFLVLKDYIFKEKNVILNLCEWNKYSFKYKNKSW